MGIGNLNLNILRNKVQKTNKKLDFNNKQLDITYITANVIGMSYPATKYIETLYRNSIENV